MKHLLSLLIATCTLSSLSAQETVTAALLYEAGLEYGGDELLTLQFTNGEEQVMLAGQGGYASIGGEFRLASVDYLALRATVGIKYNTTAADNANIAFTRIPVNIVPHFYFDEMIHVGVGVTAHQRVRLNGDGFTPDVDIYRFHLTKIRDRVWRLCIDLFHPGLHFSSRGTFGKLVWYFFHLRCTR